MVLVLVTARPAWAHGIGGRADLPVPIEFFLYGAGLVLVVTFGALGVLWPRPRLQDGPLDRRIGWRLFWLWGTLRVLGAATLVLVVLAGLFGTQGSSSNIAPVTVYVVFWLVVPFASAAVGNLWTPLNPWRTLGDWLGLDRESPASGWLASVGVWPATMAFVAWTWLELVYPAGASPRALAQAGLVYTAYAAALMLWMGREEGLQVGEAFTSYNRLVSSIAPFGREGRGRLLWRGWLRALPVIPEWRGLTAFVVAMIGTVSYDGLAATTWWNELTFRLLGPAYATIWFQTLALVAAVGVIGAGYLAASWVAARIAGSGTFLWVARSFAHTLVPIALAYAVAHYFTLVLFEGQLFISALSDPLGLGWDLFGTADRQVNYTWLAPVAVWYVQVAVIVGGHMLGVILAHDRALAVFPARVAVRSQYAMLVLMVALTVLGLTILSAG